VLIDQITRSCSNEKVALAAVASLGNSFADRICMAASRYGLTTGAFAANAVRRFAHSAGENEHKAVRRAMVRSDQPILAGLQYILESALDERVTVQRPTTDGKRQACG
jgi:hypothetical protein